MLQDHQQMTQYLEQHQNPYIASVSFFKCTPIQTLCWSAFYCDDKIHQINDWRKALELMVHAESGGRVRKIFFYVLNLSFSHVLCCTPLVLALEEAQAGRSLNSMIAWSTEEVPRIVRASQRNLFSNKTTKSQFHRIFQLLVFSIFCYICQLSKANKLMMINQHMVHSIDCSQEKPFIQTIRGISLLNIFFCYLFLNMNRVKLLLLSLFLAYFFVLH